MTGGYRCIHLRMSMTSHLNLLLFGYGVFRDNSMNQSWRVAGSDALTRSLPPSLLNAITSLYPKRVDIQADHLMVLATFSPPVTIEGRRRYRMPLQFVDDYNLIEGISERLELLPKHYNSGRWEIS